MRGLRPHDWTATRARLTPERAALVDTTSRTTLTFADLDRRVNQTARWLDERGVRAGDRVAVLAHNCVGYLEVWLAVHKLGALLQALNWRLRGLQLQELLQRAPPRLVLEDDACQTLANEACAGLDLPRFPVDVLLTERDSLSPAPVERPELDLEAPWVICYTGGTTGLPKGALLTHRSILFNAINTVTSWGLDANDVAILNAPLFHTGGLNVFTAPLIYAGGTSLVCPRFDPDQVFDLVEGGATVFFGVPTMFQMLQAHPRWQSADFSRLKLVISGGAPCPAPVFERFFERGVDFRTGYGLTEAGPNNFSLPKGRVRDKPGCVGQPLMHVEARLVDGEGRLVEGPGAEGELVVRGPHVMAGYDGDEAATRAVLDAQGWLRTGDLARRDEDGDYTIVGRKKDLIISGGENIYPAQVESAIYGHPAVAEVAVIGVPDDTWGEAVKACVVAKPGETVDPASVIDWTRERLAGFKVPKTIDVIPALPRNASGKILRRELRAPYWEGRERMVN